MGNMQIPWQITFTCDSITYSRALWYPVGRGDLVRESRVLASRSSGSVPLADHGADAHFFRFIDSTLVDLAETGSSW